MGATATKAGVKKILSASESTIRKGFGLAGSIARKYIHIDKNTKENQKQVKQGKDSNDYEEVVNQNADHNSYNVGVGKYLQSYHPKAEYNLQENIEGLRNSSRRQSYPRKKIFEKKEEQKVDHKLLEEEDEQKFEKDKSKQEHGNSQHQPQIHNSQECNQENSANKKQEILDMENQNMHKDQLSVSNVAQSKELSPTNNTTTETKQQVKIEVNKVVDLQNGSESSDTQKEKYECKISEENIEHEVQQTEQAK